MKKTALYIIKNSQGDTVASIGSATTHPTIDPEALFRAELTKDASPEEVLVGALNAYYSAGGEHENGDPVFSLLPYLRDTETFYDRILFANHVEAREATESLPAREQTWITVSSAGTESEASTERQIVSSLAPYWHADPRA